MVKLLIVDPSEEIRFTLTNLLRQDYTVLSCDSGDRALELLRREKPDLLVMELVLSGIDGLSLLTQARTEGICPPALVVSLFLHDHVIQALQKENVAYLMRKPCDLQALNGRIRELASDLSPRLALRPAPRNVISTALFELWVATSRLGFVNCREAILMLAENPTASLSKDIYPVLAEAQGVSATAIEKNIRDAITDAYNRRSEPVWRRYFPTAPDGRIPKPSNRLFLSTLAQVLFVMEQKA